MKTIYILLMLSIASGIASAQNLTESYRPIGGYVLSAKTAKIIAEAVLVPIYGSREINRQKPFKVVGKENVWIVQGSTPADRSKAHFFGGRFTIHITRSTGEIIHLSHSK